jgi:beta-N-acetylhexosaminidase
MTSRRTSAQDGRRIFSFLLLLILISTSLVPGFGAQAQTPTPAPEIQSLFAKMTPEERVGQLFLVTFLGTDVSTDSQIYDLIANHHVGGVMLQSANDNFTVAPSTVADLHTLIENLQRMEWESTASPASDPTVGQDTRENYVPLWMGISQEGNGYPTDQILNGLTPLPSPMAIGATWNPDIAHQVGEVQGMELSALGVNLYLGPSLDVLDVPNPTASSDMGTRVFGGDPYWVGEMGRAYIAGLHTGSENQMAVIAKHFPGRGDSDRMPEDEVSTVRKSLEQLKQIELYPFFAVTGNASSPEATADGLLISHIRYQGFQGNIRVTTRPVSFDSQALTQILSLPQFVNWRNAGGLIVSDDLGTRAVRDFYLDGDVFTARTVARDAFLAGNDLLNLGQIVSSDAPDNYTTVLQILDYFTTKYRDDPAFAQQVDAAVLRILGNKYRLYPDFTLANVITSQAGLANIGKSGDLTFDVARRGATLISPSVQDLTTVLPNPPQVRERLVFITDTLMVKQCSTCPEQATLEMNALENSILRLYGPEAENQTSTFRVASYTFDHLQQMLDGASPPYIESDLDRANWIILVMSDASRGQPALVSRFLTERQTTLRDRRVILFSFGAPYYFDATDISKLTAYYTLYSKQAPVVDVAARLLFQELTPSGSSPVSIPGTGYDLISVMTPDPNQIIPLTLDFQPDPDMVGLTVTPGVTPEATPMPLFRIGDTIAIRTGVIRDHNGHPVPDGTIVRFSMVLTGEGGGILQQVESATAQGMARASFGLDKPGLLEIRAASEPAVLSEGLQLDVNSAGAAAVTVIVPFVITETPLPPTPTVVVPVPEDPYVTTDGYMRFNTWFVLILFLSGIAWLSYWAISRLKGAREGVRWALCILLGGMVASTYLTLGLPGSTELASQQGVVGMLLFTFLGELLGAIGAWVWMRRANAAKSQAG